MLCEVLATVVRPVAPRLASILDFDSNFTRSTVWILCQDYNFSADKARACLSAKVHAGDPCPQARRLLGYTPSVSREEAQARTMRWLEATLAKRYT